jgi:hypothetical protein
VNDQVKSRQQSVGRFSNTVLSNLSAIIAILFVVIPAIGWWFSESVKEFIEGNSYRIESVDRYAIPSNTFTRLVGAERRSNESTRIAVVLSNSSPCSRQSPQTNTDAAALDMGTLIGTMPPGLLATIRFTRRASTSEVNFEITSGHILFVAMQGGDLPRRICFNERKDTVYIQYSPGDTADISPRERVFFIQTDEPASDIESNVLRERSSAYFALASLAGVCVFVFFVGLLILITRNAHHDRDFEDTANNKLDELKIDVSEVKDKQKTLEQMRVHFDLMSSNLENVTRDSIWIKELLQRGSRKRGMANAPVQKVNLQELKRQGEADGERRFEAGAADVRQRFSRNPERDVKSRARATADPRMEIRQMKVSKETR